MRAVPLLALAFGCPVPDPAKNPLEGDGDGDGFAEVDGDCDDADAQRFPGSAETCDGADQDCDDEIDEGLPTPTWYLDADGDGHGAWDDPGVAACAAPEDRPASTADDCFDGSEYRFDRTVWPDLDHDGQGDRTAPGTALACGAAVPPDTTEEGNADCDDGDPDVTGDGYVDADGDGYGTGVGTYLQECEPADRPPAQRGLALRSGDCNDGRGDVYPTATEACDDEDTNCNGLGDEPYVAWYPDVDQDGFGADVAPFDSCARPNLMVDDNRDCDDGDDLVNPDGADVDCDGVDNDCDTLVDDEDPDWDPTGHEFWVDVDADGHGRTGPADAWFCDASVLGYARDALDCDDSQPDVSPDGTEVCVGAAVDEDCDGLVDEEDPSLSDGQWFPEDSDADTFGHPTNQVYACSAAYLYAADNTDDCDDLDVAVGPTLTAWPDADGDGYGDASGTAQSGVDCPLPAGLADNGLDCDDGDDAYPGFVDTCIFSGNQTCGSGTTEPLCLEGAAYAFSDPLLGLETQSPQLADLDQDGVDDVVLGVFGSPVEDGDELRVVFTSGATPASWVTTAYRLPTDPDGPGPIVDLTYHQTNRGFTRGAILDRDADGRPDLAIADQNRGDGSWGTLWLLTGPLTPVAGNVALPDEVSAPVPGVLRVAMENRSGLMQGYAIAGGELVLGAAVGDELVVSAPALPSGDSFVYVLPPDVSPASLGGAGVLTLVETDPTIDGLGTDVAIGADFDGNDSPALALASHGTPTHGTEVLVVAGTDIGSGVVPSDVAVAWFTTDDVVSTSADRPPDVSWGDVNADGSLDLVFGSPDTADDRGHVYVFHGPIAPGAATPADTAASLVLDLPHGSCGTAVTLVGTRLVIACPDAPANIGTLLSIDARLLVGEVSVVAGNSEQITPPVASWSSLGSKGLAAGDLDGDTVTEVVFTWTGDSTDAFGWRTP